MSQQPLELPPTIVHPDEEDEYLPRGWGYNWDYGFHTGRFSPGINPQYLPPSVPHPQQASIDILDTLQDEIYKSHGLTYQQVVDGLDQQIDEALMHEKADPFSLDVSRSDTIERLYVEKTNLSQHYEKQAAALLGRAVDGVPSHINVADYQRLHGNPADHPEVFRQRMTEALIAAQLFWTANWQSWLYLQKIPSDQWTNVRERVAARIAARNNRAEAARIAAEAAQAEAARIAAEAAQAEAARIAAEAAQAEAARIAAEAAQAEAARIAAEAAQAEAARIAAEAAQAEAARIAAEAAQAEAARIAAEAAQAEAARIAAEAAQAEAARIAAEAMSVRIANTYAAPAAPVKAGVAVVTPSGLVVSTLTSAAMRAAVTAAIGVVAANPVVAAGAVLGVAALVYTSRLGDGKAPERYTLQLPAGDLLAQAVGEGLQPKAGTTVDLPYRIGSRSNAAGDSEIFVAKTDNVNAPAAVRVIGASYDQASGLYIATTADTPPRTLTWTPAVAPGDSSTTSPEVNPEPPIYSGATITPIDLRIDSFPELEDASFDDYIIVFPADSGLDPIYTMFKSRRDEPGVATGGSVPSTENWVDAAASMTGASIPISIAEKLRGREFRSFGAFRRALWKAMYKEAKNSSGVEQYIYGAKPGSAPYTKESERVGGRSRYEIHHVIPIHAGGAVYDMDNLRILTPKQHINIHKK